MLHETGPLKFCKHTKKNWTPQKIAVMDLNNVILPKSNVSKNADKMANSAEKKRANDKIWIVIQFRT